MTIQIGQELPNVTLKMLTDSGMKEVQTKDIFAKKKVIVFGLPGAFTPTCSQKHLPGFIENAPALKKKGVDEIVCLSVNDPFVMKAWGDSLKAGDRVTLLPDGNAELTKAIGLDFDGKGSLMGTRAKRFLMTVENNVVKSLDVEPTPGDLGVSSATACLAKL